MKKKILIGVIIVLVAVVFFGLVWIYTGESSVKVNYVKKLNEMSRPAGTEEAENARVNYEKAIDLYIEPNEALGTIIDETAGYDEYFDMTGEAQKMFGEWIKENEGAWEEFTAGSNLAYYWYEYDEGTTMLTIMMPALGAYRALAKLGMWRAVVARQEGRDKGAVADYLAVLRVGRHLQGKPVLVEHLVGMAIVNLGFSEIMHFLETATLPAEELEELQKELTEFYKGNYPRANLAGERDFFMDMVQRSFTDGGLGGGRLAPSAWDDDLDSMLGGGGLGGKLSVIFHAGRNATAAKANEMYDLWDQMAAARPYQVHKSKMTTLGDVMSELPKVRYALIHALFPALDRVVWLDYRSKVSYEAVVTVLALQRWQLEKGGYPAKLEELVEGGYLQKLPEDPFGPGILPYQRRDDGFILYSWGGDFDDDGGVEDPDNRWGEGDKGGDYVFWPIKKN